MRSPSSPHQPLDDIFAADGPLGAALPRFEARAGQVQMAKLVERGFLEDAHTLVEAGTGVGKSLAYLVPALRTGKRVVISTGTIALQEQLVQKDIPLVVEALGLPTRVVLLKGRNHYLCRQKLDRQRADRLIAQSRTMAEMWEWGTRTATGDRSELPFVPPADEWELLDADADDCVGELCSRFRDCHYFAVRDAARYADLVVVNHALFFLDLAMGGGLLPAYDHAVLDEAHQCERWATAALTGTVSARTVGRVMRRLHRGYHLPAAYDVELDAAMRALMSALGAVPGDRYPLTANERADEHLAALGEVFARLENWLIANWQTALRTRPENEAEAERRRDLALRGIVAHIATITRARAEGDASIAWVERGDAGSGASPYAVNTAPFDVAGFLRETLFARGGSVVLTSATIADGQSFGFLRRTLGIDAAQELVAPSPFDYRAQARLYVAPPAFNPKDDEFAERAAVLIEEVLDRTNGRAFVLFTSFARLREIAALLRGRIAYPFRVQGELPRTRLLAWFRSTPNAVLFATGTFWEGIDVVGDQLSCVIVDRLPFPSPSDPLVAARLASLAAQGRSGFDEYMVPSAIVRLKQGFGRLIRSRSDRGVLVLLDGRAAAMRYGATILSALPQARRVDDLRELDDLFSNR